jgi:orotate phosphoribosyltransferase
MEKLEVKIAKELMQIKAIKLQPASPFTWASGWKSPIYCDNRKTLYYPGLRTYIKEQFSKLIKEKHPGVEVIAGVATGAIAQGALVAEELGLPFVYVRSAPKGHGMGNLIEGDLQPGKKVVVIEDLISTGGSSLKAVEALRAAGSDVLEMFAIFTYGFRVAVDNFEKAGVKLTVLSDYDTLVSTAIESGYVSEEQLETLSEWRKDPGNWKKD